MYYANGFRPALPCRCGSEQPEYKLLDAQGIFVSYVCDACIERVKARYNPWVFEGYDQAFLDEYSGERIEDDY